jgi:hypothetical protein
MLDEFNNKTKTCLSTLWFNRMHKIKINKLFHHEIHSGKLYSNGWSVEGITTTLRKKTHNGHAETHEQNYYKM